MDKKLIEDAYRKLKGSVYWDKTVPFLRMRIVEYENGGAEKKIENIYKALHDEVKWNGLKEKILKSIQVLTFPKHTLFCWNDIYFATYCCYELTSISLRHIFQGTADIIFGVEWNRDTHYFGNIMESLSRDIYCYCVQANMSKYGDSRIIQPTKKDFMNILKVKGGINASVLIGEIDIQELREHQKKDCSDKGIFKPLPAGWNENKSKDE